MQRNFLSRNNIADSCNFLSRNNIADSCNFLSRNNIAEPRKILAFCFCSHLLSIFHIDSRRRANRPFRGVGYRRQESGFLGPSQRLLDPIGFSGAFGLARISRLSDLLDSTKTTQNRNCLTRDSRKPLPIRSWFVPVLFQAWITNCYKMAYFGVLGA